MEGRIPRSPSFRLITPPFMSRRKRSERASGIQQRRPKCCTHISSKCPSSVRLDEQNMPITQTRIVRIVVEGTVQGVGYRVFVSREAERLQLDGWVRNRRDGSVETLVAGPSAVVEQFLIAARRGPRTAAVASHRIEEADEAALREGGGEHGFVVAGED